MTVLLAALWLLAIPSRAEIYTVFSDKGVPPSTAANNVIQFCGPNSVCSFQGLNSDFAVPEGTMSFRAGFTGIGWAGWGFDYGAASRQDLSRFQNGELRFWVRSPHGNVEITIKQNDNQAIYQKTLITAGVWNPAMANRWTLIRLPLNSSTFEQSRDLRQVQYPVIFTGITAGTFYIDHVRYVSPPDSAASPLFSARLCNNGDVSCATPATQMTWANVTPASSWRVADQYIQLSVDADTTTWGVQIYTNNRATSANPQYIVNGSSNPAGLINTALRGLSIPLAWSVKPATAPASQVTPVATEPNNGANLNSFQWLYMKDAQTPSIPAENTGAFQPGELAVTVRNNLGIHFGQAPNEFGAENSPNYIFLEADFGRAMAASTYRTSTLTIEFFTL